MCVRRIFFLQMAYMSIKRSSALLYIFGSPFSVAIKIELFSAGIHRLVGIGFRFINTRIFCSLFILIEISAIYTELDLAPINPSNKTEISARTFFSTN
jgi:hypothetical protein